MGSKNVGKSSAHPDENSGPQKPEVSSATFIDGGLGDPNFVSMSIETGDGEAVNIPPLSLVCLTMTLCES